MVVVEIVVVVVGWEAWGLFWEVVVVVVAIGEGWRGAEIAVMDTAVADTAVVVLLHPEVGALRVCGAACAC